jgi:hypothetical protein
MFSLVKPFVLKALGLVCVFVGAGGARAVDLQTLVDRSPFSSGGQGAEGAIVAEPQGTWEFRGMATDSDGTAYNLFDATTNKGRWVRPEDPDSPVQIKGFDPANSLLEIEQDGRPLRLSLKRAVIQTGQSVAEMAPPAVRAPDGRASPGRRTAARSLAAKTDPAAEEKRLQAVADAVRRSRERRQAAMGQARQNGQPAGTPARPGS